MSQHSRKKHAATPKTKPKPPAQKPASEDTDAAEEKAFIESLIASGQAARADAQGTLPPGVTHEIVESEEGDIKVVRRRFSAY